MRHLIHTTLLSLIAGALVTGCNTPAFNDWGEIKVGMDKMTVVEKAGNPNVVERYQGKDRWIYLFDDTPDGGKRREVLFENERAVYVGPRILPKVSAAEQDKINETILQDDTKRESEIQLARDKRLGVARVQDPEKAPVPGTSVSKEEKIDELDLRIRDSYYGTNSTQEYERTKSAPVFEPVQ